MASPQAENGHVRISNEYYDQLLRADLGRRDLKVMLAVIRETWGWGRKTKALSNSHLGRMTSLHRSRVAETIDELARRRLLTRTEAGALGPQKDYERWLPPVVTPCDETSHATKRRRRQIVVTPCDETSPKPRRNVAPSKTERQESQHLLQATPAGDLLTAPESGRSQTLTPGTEPSWPGPGALVRLYNEEIPPGHPRVTTLSAGRRKKATEYLRQFPDEAFWRSAFGETRHSALLRGRRPSPGHEHFIADFDWLLSKGKDGTENIVKVAEGKYRDRASAEEDE